MSRDTQSGLAVARRPLLKATATGVGVAGLAGCLGDDDDDADDGDDTQPADDGDDADDTEPVEEVHVGGVMPYTGPFVEVAQEFEAGLLFAFDEYNGSADAEYELTFDGVDSETDPSEAVTIATQMIEQDDVSILTGPVSSDVGIAVNETAETNEVPLVFSMVGDGGAITVDSRHTFRLGLLPAPTTAESIVQFIEDRDLQTVRAIIADYAYGQAFREALDEYLPDDLDYEYEVAPFGEDDFSTYLRDMPDDLDVLIGTSHPPGANSIHREALELELNPEYVLGNSEANPNWTALGEDLTEGYLSIHQPYPYSDQYAEVAEAYGEETGDHFGVLASLGYSAGQLMVSAVEEAGGGDRAAIAEAIREGEVETLFYEPIQYTERGELHNKRQVFSAFEVGAPDYYPDGDFTLVEEFLTDPIEGFDGHPE